MQQQQVEALDAAALEARLGGAPQVRGIAARTAETGIGEPRKSRGAVALAIDEVVADGADEPERRAVEPRDRSPDEPVGLALAVDVGRHDGTDALVRAQKRHEPVIVERHAVVEEPPAAPGTQRRMAEIGHGRRVPRR